MAGVFGLSDFRIEQLEGNIDESANYGYFGGGIDVQNTHTNTIDKIDLFNETTSAPGNDIQTAFSYLAGVSNSLYGYFAGGYNPTTGYDGTDVISRLDFSNELVTSPLTGSQLTEARWGLGGIFSPEYGYFAGGRSNPSASLGVVCTIDRIDFTTETVSVPPASAPSQLTDARSSFATFNTTDYGYFFGGSTPPFNSVVDRLDFSNETTSAPGNNLPSAKSGQASVYTKNYGYAAGGQHPPTAFVCTIDRLEFSNETLVMSLVGFTEERDAWSGVSGLDYGYFAGGAHPPSFEYSKITRLDFANETTFAPSPPSTFNLTKGRKELASFSGGKSVNARNRKSTDKNGKSISGKYAYYGGGYAISSPYQNIDRMEYATETMTTLPSDFELSQRRSELSAAGNSNYGYFIGGWSQPLASSKIDRMDFSNETLTDNLSLNPTAFGTFGVKRTTSLANNNYIYTAGGSGPSGGDDKEVTRMDLSTEVLTSRDMLTADRAYMSSLRTSSYGYFCGGEGPPPFGGKNKSSYQRLDFSTESVIDSSFPSMMNTKRQEFASFQSPEYGYVAGGDGSPGDQCRIERLDFSSETFTYTSNSMPEGREGVNGFCNENFGYIAGGWSPGNRSVIDRMEFSSETMSLPGVELQKGNSYTGGTVSDNGITHF
jgi:hypothetical protein